jgi:trk system potassium uptake protein TrkA
MYVVIAGAGKVGHALAYSLYSEGHDVAVIEKDLEICKRAEALDILVVRGNAGALDVLANAGIENAELFIGATNNDETNLIACAYAKSKGAKTIARIDSADYLNEPISKAKFRYLGVDIALCPALVVGIKIARSLLKPTLLDADIFAKGKVQVLEAIVDKNSPAANKTLKEIKFPRSCSVVAIIRNGDVIIPTIKDSLIPNDNLVIMLGNSELIPSVEGVIGGKKVTARKEELKRVMIVGATRTGVHIAKLLEKYATVTLIEPNKELCEKVSAEFSSAIVTHGNPMDRELLVGEGIKGIDAFIATTDKDETNMLSALLAKEEGAKSTIALIDTPELKASLETVGIDMIINPRLVTISTILQYARKSELLSFKLLKEGEAQVLEFIVTEQSPTMGKKLKDTSFPKNSIIGAIVRNEKVIVPTSEDTLHLDDKVIIFAKTDALPKLEKLF